MIQPLFQRLALLAGERALEKLAQARVMIVGVGGVGSWCAEALVRSGIGSIDIVDYDTVCASNVNRQSQATSKTLGRAKTEVLKERLLEINPDCKVTTWEKCFSRENAAEFNIERVDYVIDAIDTFPNKLDLIEISRAAGVTLFSSMGMACKMDPTRIKTAGIWETHGCPLARLVRQGLRKRGFNGNFTAVYSDERFEALASPPSTPSTGSGAEGGEGGEDIEGAGGAASLPEPVEGGKKINGSVVTVTATAGMVLASLVLRDITGDK